MIINDNDDDGNTMVMIAIIYSMPTMCLDLIVCFITVIINVH